MFGNLFKKHKKKETKKAEVNASVFAVELAGSKITLGNAQHQGGRPYQEDSFGFSDISPAVASTKGILAVLADGMGGLSNGKAVSEIVVSSLREWFNNPSTICTSGADLRNAILAVNERVCDLYCKDGTVTSGSTVVAAMINNGILHWACVGDSRLYIKRDIRLHQLNEDHDYQNQLLEKVITGESTFGQVAADPQKDSLVCCIGKRNIEKVDFSIKGMPLDKKDIVVLCSDGVYNALPIKEFAELVTENTMESCEAIIRAVANKRIPHQDNNTIMTMSFR